MRRADPPPRGLCRDGRMVAAAVVPRLIVAEDDGGEAADRIGGDAEIVVQVAIPGAGDPALAHPAVVDDRRRRDLLARRSDGRRRAVLREVYIPRRRGGIIVRRVRAVVTGR